MEDFSYWTAGHSAHVSPESGMGAPTILPSGEGAVVPISTKTASTAYVHFAIPTPTRIESQRASLRQVILLYETSGEAVIDTHEVWHAKTQIWSNQVVWKGQHSGPAWDHAHNVVFTGSVDVDYSIGLTVRIKLEHGEGQGEVLFVSAGANFSADV